MVVTIELLVIIIGVLAVIFSILDRKPRDPR